MIQVFTTLKTFEFQIMISFDIKKFILDQFQYFNEVTSIDTKRYQDSNHIPALK